MDKTENADFVSPGPQAHGAASSAVVEDEENQAHLSPFQGFPETTAKQTSPFRPPHNIDQSRRLVKCSDYADIPPLSDSIPGYLWRRMVEYEGTALKDSDTGELWSYSRLQSQVDRVAANLLKVCGVTRDDVFAVVLPNCPHMCVLTLAVWKVGAVVAPLSPASGSLLADLQHLAATYVMLPHDLEQQQDISKLSHIKKVLTLGGGSPGRPAEETYERLVCHEEDNGVVTFPFLEHDELALLLFTTGNTGTRNTVMLSHKSVVAQLEQLKAADFPMRTNQRSLIMACLPLSHVLGLVQTLLCGLTQGHTIVMTRDLSVSSLGSKLAHEKINCLILSYPLLRDLLRYHETNRDALVTLHTVISWGAVVPATVLEYMQQVLPRGADFRQAYGLTETCGVTHCSPPANTLPASAGILVASTEQKLVSIPEVVVKAESADSEGKVDDEEERFMLETGERGELWVRGPQCMMGYFSSLEKSVVGKHKEGWISTGDYAFSDEDGNLYTLNQISDLILKPTEISTRLEVGVAPAELEELVLKEGGGDILDCAVLNLNNIHSPRTSLMHQTPALCLLVKEDIKDAPSLIKHLNNYLNDFLQKRNVAADIQKVEIADVIPRRHSGSINRKWLRENLFGNIKSV